MSEGFELSFKNKEVRMWIYLAIPMLIVGIILIYYGEVKYQYIPFITFLIIYYTWRYFYRRKQKQEGKRTY